jgi:hypothetical protein
MTTLIALYFMVQSGFMASDTTTTQTSNTTTTQTKVIGWDDRD